MKPNKIDQVAINRLTGQIGLFEPFWGKLQAKDGYGGHFTQPCPPFSSMRYSYLAARKLFSRIYKIKLSGSIPAGLLYTDDFTLKLFYQGSLKRSGSAFKEKGKSSGQNPILTGLNQEGKLFTECCSLDLEELEVKYLAKEDMFDISLVPYPGSFAWTLLPPIKYLVKLKPGEVEGIAKIFDLLGHFLKQCAVQCEK